MKPSYKKPFNGPPKARRRGVVDGPASPLEFSNTVQSGDTMSMVRTAIANKQAMLAYQPIMSATSGDRPAFYEGLIRILDDTGRIIPAREFMGVVDATEMGRTIDCLALELGFRALAQDPGLRLSINLSARSIGYPRWMKTLQQGIGRDPTAGERIILEITEASVMTMPENVSAFIEELSLDGIAFALDEFGKGMTSISLIQDLLFDMVKIDARFSRGVSNDPDKKSVVRVLANIAQEFDMYSVAVGVEDAQDVAYLASIGVNCMQGYYFGAPTIKAPWEKSKKRKRA